MIIIKPLFNQVKPIEIEDLFFEGDLDFTISQFEQTLNLPFN